jgi:hypothetical protein
MINTKRTYIKKIDTKESLLKKGLSKTTIWRALNRGWYCKKYHQKGIGYIKDKPKNKPKSRWTEKEVKLIYKYFPNVEKIMEILPHRSYSAIVNRCKILGLKFNEET